MSGQPCRVRPDQYLTPYYGPSVPCNATECDPCDPKLWNQNVSYGYNPELVAMKEKSNIVSGGWRTAFGWHGDLNLRSYQYQFFERNILTPINFYWTRPPHTDYAWEQCQKKK